jgi:hypothetical protein
MIEKNNENNNINKQINNNEQTKNTNIYSYKE